MHSLQVSLRLCLLLLVGIAAAILWLFCDAFLDMHFINAGYGTAGASRLGGISTLLLLTIVFGFPIASLFPHHSVRAALAVGWFPLVVAALQAYQVDVVVPGKHLISQAVIEGFCAWVAIILGAFVVATLRAKLGDANGKQSVSADAQKRVG